MAILGESFDGYVNKQIKTRQNLLALNANHDNNFLKYTHSRTAFLRLTSGVDVTDQSVINNLDLNNISLNSGLASSLVISNANFSKGLTQGLGGLNASYGFLSNTDYGYTPPPGILSADIRSLNRGSLREATVNLVCHNLNQFQVIDTLFLKLRYSFLLEWGNTTYFNNSGTLVTPASVPNLSKDFLDWKQDQYALLNKIEQTRIGSSGNYDAFFGVIKNFSWELQPNGSYNITIVGISQGDVIESLKLNSNVTPDETSPANQQDSKFKTCTLTRILGLIYEKSLSEGNNLDGYSGRPFFLASSKIASELSIKPNFLRPDDNDSVTAANSSLAKNEAPYILFYTINPDMGDNYMPRYIKLGALLRIIEAFLLTYDTTKSNAPSFRINYSYKDSDNRCLTIPNHIAIDPRICVIPLKFDAKKVAAAIGNNDQLTNTFTANFIDGKYNPKLTPSTDLIEYNALTDDDITSRKHAVPTANTTGNALPTPYYLTGSAIVLQQTIIANSIDIVIDDPINFSKGIGGIEQLLDTNPIKALQGGATPSDTVNGTPINDVNDSFAKKYDQTNANSSFQAVLSGSSDDAIDQQNGYKGSNSNVNFNNFNGSYGTDSNGNRYFIFKTLGNNQYKISDGIGGEFATEGYSVPVITTLKQVTSARVSYTKSTTAPLADALAAGGVLQYLDKSFNSDNNLIGNTMHMYINIDHAVDLLNKNIDESGNISVYNFLKTLMQDVQRSLGNINDFEVICNDTNNTYTIIDNALIPHISKPKPDSIANFNINTLQNNTANGGSFITNFSLKTELFARVANAIAIGSQANGTTLQSNSSTFSFINEGIKDRVLTTKQNANTNQTDNDDVFEKKYTKAYASFSDFVAKYLGIKYGVNNGSTLTPEDIQQYNSSLVDLFNYDLGIYTKKGQFTGTGFIPLNLQLTMDGLSGIKIYQVFTINDTLLPSMYKNKIQFIIKGVNHRISDKGWETNVETLSIPKKLTSGNPAPSRLNIQTLSGGGGGGGNILPRGSGPTPEADRLRKELSTYNYKEKGNELANYGYDLTSEIVNKALDFIKDLSAKYPSYRIQFTGGNDEFHHLKAPNSIHTKGKALDFVIDFPSPTPEVRNNILAIARKYFKVLDEYANPSPQATAPHIHVYLS